MVAAGCCGAGLGDRAPRNCPHGSAHRLAPNARSLSRLKVYNRDGEYVAASNSRDDPNSRFCRTISTALSLFVLLLSVAVCMVAMSTILRREVGVAVNDTATLVRQWHRSIGFQLTLPAGLTSALASTPVFTTPSDYAEYKRRLEPIDRMSSRGLPADVLRNARSAGYGTLVRGHLYRGLPLTTTNGRPLLRTQRRLAVEIATRFSYVDSVSECDSLGRFVFAEPYAQQEALEYFDIGRSAFFQSIRKNPDQWIVHSSFDGSSRHVISRATPIVRNRNVDGYLVLSIDPAKAFGGNLLNIALPSDIASLSTQVGLPDGDESTIIQVENGSPGVLQRALSFAPRRLTGWLFPTILSGQNSTDARATCQSRLQGDPFGVMTCQESLEGIPRIITTTTLRFDNALIEVPLSVSLGLLCFVAALSVLFSVRLFGDRWSILAGEKELGSRNLVSALNNLTHDLRQVIQNLRGELRLLKADLNEARTEARIDPVGTSEPTAPSSRQEMPSGPPRVFRQVS